MRSPKANAKIGGGNNRDRQEKIDWAELKPTAAIYSTILPSKLGRIEYSMQPEY
jgi:hypothetical protein